MDTYQQTVESAVGEFGIAQLYIVLASKLGYTACAWPMVMMSFAGATPNWWSVSLQWNGTGNGNGTWVKVRQTKVCPTSANQTVEYDPSLNSIVNEWNLICERKWIPSLITTIQMVGVLVGAAIVGQLGDWIGRKRSMVLMFGLMLSFTLISAFSPLWQVMAACRFVIGIAMGGYLVVSLLYPVEFVGTSWRTFVGALPFWSSGVMLFGVVTIFVKDWKKLAYAVAAFGAAPFITLLFVPESVRWLLVKGRRAEAVAILRKMAKLNKRGKPALDRLEVAVDAECKTDKANHTYWTVLRNKSTRYNVIACSVFWFTSALVYYGLTFGISNLSGDASINMILFGVMETFAMFCDWLIAKWLGRRRSLIMWFLLSGLLSLGITVSYFASTRLFVKAMNWLAILARFALSAAWSVAIMYTSELFPTSVRTLGFAMSSVAGRVGGIVGSQIGSFNEYIVYLPYTVYAALVFGCVLMAIFLPDTYHSELQDFLPEGDEKLSKIEDGKTESTLTLKTSVL